MSQIQWKAEAAAVPGVKKGDLIAFQVSRTKYRFGRVISNTAKKLTLESAGEHYEIASEDYADVAFPITLSYMRPSAVDFHMKDEYTLAKLRKLQNPDGDVRTTRSAGPKVNFRDGDNVPAPRTPKPPAEPANVLADPTDNEVESAVKAFKGVIVDKVTPMGDGSAHITLSLSDVSLASALFTLRRVKGTKVRVVNPEVSAIPHGDPDGSGRWTKVRVSADDVGAISTVLRPVIEAMRKKAKQKVGRGIHTPAPTPAPTSQRKAPPKHAPAPQSSGDTVEAAIRDLETQRDNMLKDFNDRIAALRTSHRTNTTKGALYGVGAANTTGAAVYKKLFSGSFRPFAGKKYPVKIGDDSMQMHVTHVVSNDIYVVDVARMGSRTDNILIAVRGEGIWNENDMSLPDKYKRYL